MVKLVNMRIFRTDWEVVVLPDPSHHYTSPDHSTANTCAWYAYMNMCKTSTAADRPIAAPGQYTTSCKRVRFAKESMFTRR